jgi:hypothetical protein
LHGAADAAHVRTNSTTFVSSTELVANVTIASDAQLDFWDVQIALAGGKNGVGSELFEVTSAQILGSGTTGGDAYVYGMSEDRQVSGYAGGGGTAFVFADDAGMVNLGGGQAWTIDPLGMLVAGSDSTGDATAWVRQSTSSWVAEHLPRLASSVGGNVEGAARAADGTLLVVGFDDSTTATRRSAQQYNRVVLWRRTGGTWSAPQSYLLPAGTLRGSARAVNGLAEVVGQLDNGASGGAVWENPTTFTRLDGIPNAINAAGNLIVGVRSAVPVYWWRDPSTGAWNPTGVVLPSIGTATCTVGEGARGLNSAGIIVGSSCNSAGKTQATVWRLDLSGGAPVLTAGPAALPGLGFKNTTTNELSDAVSVTGGAPFIVAGTIKSSGARLAVRWQLDIVP